MPAPLQCYHCEYQGFDGMHQYDTHSWIGAIWVCADTTTCKKRCQANEKQRSQDLWAQINALVKEVRLT